MTSEAIASHAGLPVACASAKPPAATTTAASAAVSSRSTVRSVGSRVSRQNSASERPAWTRRSERTATASEAASKTKAPVRIA